LRNALQLDGILGSERNLRPRPDRHPADGGHPGGPRARRGIPDQARRQPFDALGRRLGHVSPSLLAIVPGRSITVSVVMVLFAVAGL